MQHDSIAPGMHVPRAGKHQVVWWDPHVLRLGVDIGGGLRQQQILEADDSNERATASEQAHVRWLERRATSLLRAMTPSLETKSVTEASRLELLEGIQRVALESTSIDRVNRPNGRRFGSLVHAVLAAIDLRGDDAHVRAVAVNQARLIDASASEVDAAVVAVRAAVVHPLMQRAAAAPILRREIPIVHDTPGLMLEGIIDLAFADDAGWVVVDYKTDPELAPEVRAPYEAQVRAYASAITAATSLPASAALLLV
jgi:ATP-dependent exoDNAse (exonuclease V) beta subunit